MAITENYSSRDWEQLTTHWEICMFTVYPWSGEALEQGIDSLEASDQIIPFREKEWDVAARRIIQKRAELWERLAER